MKHNNKYSSKVYGIVSMRNVGNVIFTLVLIFTTVFLGAKNTVAEEDVSLQSSSPDTAVDPIPNTGIVLEPGEAPSTYTVEEGDTLYDICDQLIDNSDYWPKLWSLNPDIKNPHFIEAGTQLRFYPDDRMNPSVMAVEDADDIVPTDNTLLSEEEMYPDRIEHLLASNEAQDNTDFVDLTQEDQNFDNSFENYGFIYDPTKFTAVVPGFIFEEEPSILGHIVVGVNNEELGKEGDDFIIETENDKIKLDLNSTYTVVRVSQNVYRKKDNKKIGQRYDFIAHVRINEVLKYSESSKDNLYKADIVFSNLGLQANDIIIPYKSAFKHYNLEKKVEVYNDKDASVVDTDLKDKIYSGTGDVVFIDKKLDIGKYFPVYHSAELNKGISTIRNLPHIQRRVAIVKVISNENNSSTAVVVDSSSVIKKGDNLGKLTYQAN